MWDLIVSVPDHCLSFYFDQSMVSSIYWLCLGIIDYLLTVCLLKLKFLREKISL